MLPSVIAEKLTLNDTNTEYMIIGSRYRLSNLESNQVITIGQSNIKRVTNTNSLWLILDDQPKWKTQIDKQCKKIGLRNHCIIKKGSTFSADA